MRKFFLAWYDSRHFDFEGAGATQSEAINVLIQGLRSHAGQYGIAAEWWYEPDMQAAFDDGKPREHIEDHKRLIDDGVIQVREIELGQPYRDHSPLCFTPVKMEG
jgi:hypothetical protein